MAPRGEYFKDKEEAIAYYQQHEENLKDKPAWMIECIIDFARKYPNYKEYCEVEAKMANGEKLTEKQAKKYGHLQWEKQMAEFKDGDVIPDAVTCNKEGEYEKDDLEKLNKYDMEFGEQLEPDENIKLRIKTGAGEFEATAPVEKLNQNFTGRVRKEDFDIKEVVESIEN